MQYEDMSWSHRQDVAKLQRMSKASNSYRKKYLELRKLTRDLVLEHNLQVSAEIKKAIGIK